MQDAIFAPVKIYRLHFLRNIFDLVLQLFRPLSKGAAWGPPGRTGAGEEDGLCERHSLVLPARQDAAPPEEEEETSGGAASSRALREGSEGGSVASVGMLPVAIPISNGRAVRGGGRGGGSAGRWGGGSGRGGRGGGRRRFGCGWRRRGKPSWWRWRRWRRVRG